MPITEMENTVHLNAMIVEDEKDLCFLLSLILKQKNLNPSCVYTIADAKKSIEKINPFILFLDNRLPDGYGIDYICEVKKNHPSIKIVMITAHNTSQDIQNAMKRGADFFISKPFNSAIIRNTIDQIFPEILK